VDEIFLLYGAVGIMEGVSGGALSGTTMDLPFGYSCSLAGASVLGTVPLGLVFGAVKIVLLLAKRVRSGAMTATEALDLFVAPIAFVGFSLWFFLLSHPQVRTA
jgi:hypothetical protein